MHQYLKYLLSGTFFSLLMIAGFNWFINPYDIFESPEIKGVNVNKSEVERYTRLSKIYKVNRDKPTVLLLASSRGLIIPDSFIVDNGVSGFNMSLASGSTYELLRTLQHAQAGNKLKKVILALDEEFSGATQGSFSEERLLVNKDGSINNFVFLQKWHDMFTSLLSFDALRSSLRTVRKQNDSHAKRVVKAGGHREMFKTLEASVFNKYPLAGDGYPRDHDDNPSIRGSVDFEEIVDLSYKNNIELEIYFSPVHARLYEVYYMIGFWQKIENMKRTVVSVVNNKANKYGKSVFRIWDFSGYNSITTEELPGSNDVSSAMRWYWEGSHYTKETAKLILDTMSFKKTQHNDFGVMLTPENINLHLIAIKEQRLKYIQSHPEDLKELKTLIE